MEIKDRRTSGEGREERRRRGERMEEDRTLMEKGQDVWYKLHLNLNGSLFVD